MKILYLHDWCDVVDEAIYKVLAKFGDEVQYQKIDYRNARNLIPCISNILHKDRNSLIVGYSFGAYIAYYASTYSETPSLLINPSFYFKNGGELHPEKCDYSFTDKTFIISMKDETLDIRKTLKFLRDTNVPESNVKLYDDLTHTMPIEIFDKEFTEFRNKYIERERLYNTIENELEKKKKLFKIEQEKKKELLNIGDDGYPHFDMGIKDRYQYIINDEIKRAKSKRTSKIEGDQPSAIREHPGGMERGGVVRKENKIRSAPNNPLI